MREEASESMEKNTNEVSERKATQMKRFKWLFIVIDVLLAAYVIVEIVLLTTAK